MRAAWFRLGLGYSLAVTLVACGGGDGGSATGSGGDGSNQGGDGAVDGGSGGASDAGGGLGAGADGGGAGVAMDGGGGAGGDKDGGGTSDAGGGGKTDGGGGNGADGGSGGSDGGSVSQGLICSAHHWEQAVPASGNGIMSYKGKAYVFGATGQAWTVVQGGAAVTQAIPLPAGLASMQSVTGEISPTGRPLVSYYDGATSSYAAAFWDGAAFVNVTPLTSQPNGYGVRVHSDAQERIYEVDWQNVLTEYPKGSAQIVRGALPVKMIAWNVGLDGTVYVLHEVLRPSVIHPGNQANALMMMHLPHGSLTWSGDTFVASNEGWGYGSGVTFVIAQDGSFHVAYPLSYAGYYYRSRDGQAFAEGYPWDIVSKGTMIDPAPNGVTGLDSVKGSIALIGATDYDHAALIVASGSSDFIIRNCAPYAGINNTWPAERFAPAQTALFASDEHGMISLLTATGVRKDVSP